MILSLKPPYRVTSRILSQISTISEKLGEVNAAFLSRQSPQLRKQNRIKTIHSSLQIEGNTLSFEQVTAILDGRRVVGPEKDISEILNANKVYENLDNFKYDSERSFLKAHRILMNRLVQNPGEYRKSGVGIVQGSNIAHVAPPHANVPGLMKDLFQYLKKGDDLDLLKSCVFHYEMEFIHPFLDGNGRMGRLWQTIILMRKYPVFEFLPFGTLISETQTDYYQALAQSDKEGESTAFIEYMLDVIDGSLSGLLQISGRILTEKDRIEYFLSLNRNEFTRKDYMAVFKSISSATASRDLKRALDLGLISKTGSKNTTRYIAR